MRKDFKKFIFFFVFIGFFSAHAGSYDDFFKALERDQADDMQELLMRGFDPNSPNPLGQPALIYAMQRSSGKAVNLLMNWPSTNLSIKNLQGETPLMLAAINNQMDLAKVLIVRGADVNQTGWTPLHYAASKGHVEMMRLLIEHHAYLDAESPNGTTPLMMAAHYGSPMATKLLLEEGADPRLKNKLGLSAWDFAHKPPVKADSVLYLQAFLAYWQARYPADK
jgi:ankyrin repeat protein